MTTPNVNQYNLNVPQSPGDSFAKSQPEMLANFLDLYNKFSANHVPLDSNVNAGNHTVIKLQSQSKDVEANATQINLFSKPVEGQSDQIFLNFPGNSPAIQLTNYQLYTLQQEDPQTQYFSVLPGKLIFYFGNFLNLRDNNLKLRPAVCREVITMSVISADFVRPVSVFAYCNPPVNGFIRDVKIVQTKLSSTSAKSRCYYMVLGKL